MKNLIKVIAVILLILSCYGCDKKIQMEDIISFKAEDVTSVTTFVVSTEEVEYMQLSELEGIEKLIDLMKQVTLEKKIKGEQLEELSYYSYDFRMGEEKNFRVIDYQDKIKIIDTKGNESWYEVSSNTWEGLTTIWEEYYIEHPEIITPFQNEEPIIYRKPVIYLYPEESTEIYVKLDFKGELSYTYPLYQEGWKVFANPDGTLLNISDGKEYSYLFWEGISAIEFDMSKGFVIKGNETTKFLEEKLSYLGLNREECNDFITYWAPEMSNNAYNLITFQGEAYTESAKLTIVPKPESTLRVFMVYQPLEKEIKVPEQELRKGKRTGFSVVEWGGAEVK